MHPETRAIRYLVGVLRREPWRSNVELAFILGRQRLEFPSYYSKSVKNIIKIAREMHAIEKK